MIANRDGGARGRAATAAGRVGSPRPSPAAEDLDRGLERTRDWLLDQQRPDGYWVGELEGDTILESEYILLMAHLGREREEVCLKLGKYLFDQRRPEGGCRS